MSGDLQQLIRDKLDQLPRGKRGPKTSKLRDALTGHEDMSTCWEWPGRTGQNGYGIAVRPGTRTEGSTAHRVVWELLYGAVQDDMHVDHKCHDPEICNLGTKCPHRRCVNPTHLQVTTPRDNVRRSNSFAAVNARKTECYKGHPFSPENTHIAPNGGRVCRICRRAYESRRYYTAKGAGS